MPRKTSAFSCSCNLRPSALPALPALKAYIPSCSAATAAEPGAHIIYDRCTQQLPSMFGALRTVMLLSPDMQISCDVQWFIYCKTIFPPSLLGACCRAWVSTLALLCFASTFMVHEAETGYVCPTYSQQLQAAGVDCAVHCDLTPQGTNAPK